MYHLFVAILILCVAVAALHLAFALLLVWLIAKLITWAHNRWVPVHSGEFLDGRELDPRDVIDRVILGSREAHRRRESVKREIELRSWRG